MLPLFVPLALVNVDNNVLGLYVDWRERYESHQNPTFSSPAGKNGDNLYSRLRVGANYKYDSHWSARLEYQNSSNVFWNQSLNASTDNSDASLAYVKYSTADLTAVGGRQRIELGQQRLIGSTDWLNLGRSFDAATKQSG